MSKLNPKFHVIEVVGTALGTVTVFHSEAYGKATIAPHPILEKPMLQLDCPINMDEIDSNLSPEDILHLLEEYWLNIEKVLTLWDEMYSRTNGAYRYNVWHRKSMIDVWNSCQKVMEGQSLYLFDDYIRIEMDESNVSISIKESGIVVNEDTTFDEFNATEFLDKYETLMLMSCVDYMGNEKTLQQVLYHLIRTYCNEGKNRLPNNIADQIHMDITVHMDEDAEDEYWVEIDKVRHRTGESYCVKTVGNINPVEFFRDDYKYELNKFGN
jgi:hypothetical protein